MRGDLTTLNEQWWHDGKDTRPPFGFHDWNSKKYVLQWAERQDEEDRREQFQLMADLIPFDRGAPITFLDLGSGYGALTQFLLKQFPNAAPTFKRSPSYDSLS